MNGPGSYQIQDLFGHNLNDVTIGVRREEIQQLTPGPGTYSPEKCDTLTRVRTAMADFTRQTERKNQLESNILGPGQYESQDNFGYDLGKITIGVRRNENQLESPGPGTYNPERSESTVKNRAAAWKFADQTGRQISEVDG